MSRSLENDPIARFSAESLAGAWIAAALVVTLALGALTFAV